MLIHARIPISVPDGVLLFHLNCLQLLGPLGALFGSLLGGWLTDYAGRKPSLIMAEIPSFFGYLMIVYASIITNAVGFKFTVMLGRLLTGVGLGWSVLAASVCESIRSVQAFPHLDLVDDIQCTSRNHTTFRTFRFILQRFHLLNFEGSFHYSCKFFSVLD